MWLRRPLAVLTIVFTFVGLGCANPRNAPPDPALSADRSTGGKGGSAQGGQDSTDGPSGAGGEGVVDPNAPFTDPGCETGFHKCSDGTCVSSRDPAHCGNACVPCPGLTGGTSTCDGVRCGIECPAGKKPCLDACVDQAAACEGKCPDGKNPCNGICVDATSVSSCGTACVTCPTSQFGQTSCDGDKCVLSCNPGYHACGPVCAPNNDPMTCGASCSPCQIPTGGKATCDGTKCGTECPAGTKLCAGACIELAKACEGTCPAGTHNCNDNCVSNTDTNSCGTTQCTPCTVPANAMATCNGTSCDFTCRAGYHRCGDECKDNKSVGSCGTSSCSACPTAPNATAACDGSKCSLKCGGNLYLCNGVCQQCCNDGQCGSGKACSNNTCVTACVANQSCTTGLGPCRAGKTVCASPTSQAQCQDSGADDSRNTCGSGNVCKGGTCVAACKPGGGCSEGIPACKAGKYVCDTPTSQPACRVSGNDDNNNTCVGGNICSGGNCVKPCQPTNNCPSSPCHRSTPVCKTPTGAPSCQDNIDDNAGGCGTGLKCQGGKCVSACAANMGADCSDDCNTGTINCAGTCVKASKGAVACGPNPANHTCKAGACACSCPAGQTCSGNSCVCPNGGVLVGGQCCSTKMGAPCMVAGCKQGTFACNGTTCQNPTALCNAAEVCVGSSCVPCGQRYGPCCTNGTKSCSGGPDDRCIRGKCWITAHYQQYCGGDAPDGYGAGGYCKSSVCVGDTCACEAGQTCTPWDDGSGKGPKP